MRVEKARKKNPNQESLKKKKCYLEHINAKDSLQKKNLWG